MHEITLFRILPGKSESVNGVGIEYRILPNPNFKEVYIRSSIPIMLGTGRYTRPDQWQILLPEHKWRDGAWYVDVPGHSYQRLVLRTENGVLVVKLRYPEFTSPFPRECDMHRSRY